MNLSCLPIPPSGHSFSVCSSPPSPREGAWGSDPSVILYPSLHSSFTRCLYWLLACWANDPVATRGVGRCEWGAKQVQNKSCSDCFPAKTGLPLQGGHSPETFLAHVDLLPPTPPCPCINYSRHHLQWCNCALMEGYSRCYSLGGLSCTLSASKECFTLLQVEKHVHRFGERCARSQIVVYRPCSGTVARSTGIEGVTSVCEQCANICAHRSPNHRSWAVQWHSCRIGVHGGGTDRPQCARSVIVHHVFGFCTIFSFRWEDSPSVHNWGRSKEGQ